MKNPIPEHELERLRFEKDQKEKCRAKRKYVSEAVANDEIVRIKDKFKMGKLRSYQCPWCKTWHLTTIRRKKNDKRRV